MQKIISVKNLTKEYGQLKAVNNISFEVFKGEVFGLLGENGAGKTTTLEMIEGLRKPTKGSISVLGHDIKDGINSIKEKIGVQLQASAYFDFLTLWEILDLFGSFYQKHEQPEKLLKMVGLLSKKNSYVSRLSGGQKQRFSIIASLINNPQILFLDEPTTGLDPLARRNLWELINNIKNQGKTIILTTHYMEEAENLCDRIAIMEKGKIVAMGKTHELVEKTKHPFRIDFTTPVAPSEQIIAELKKYGLILDYQKGINKFEMVFTEQQDLNDALKIVNSLNPTCLDVGRASLEDAFIELTGRTIGDESD